MKRKILCFGIVSMFLLTGLTSLSVFGMKEEKNMESCMNSLNENNRPPDKPNISGCIKGKTGTNYTYSVTTKDSDGDQVYYNWSWGDNTFSGWLGPYDSGAIVDANHSWDKKRYLGYEIKAQAKDETGAESDWSTQTISLPKGRNFIFGRFLDNFPLLQKLFSLPFFQRILEI
jgi:hypothetical protein